ncbi:helix-turn-helix domain-containing protein [Jeotgalicoccus coquinae]|nr:helix-turn-helix domain-containing protein [Jeotgalicoccus coquinae]
MEEKIVSLYHSKTYTINEIMKITGVSKGTIYNVINQEKLNT